MPSLADYRPIIGDRMLEELQLLVKHLAGRRVVMVNSTKAGGGVAEILHRMVPLLQELGLDVRWEVIEGSLPFYTVTKKFHNALHGKAEMISQEMFDTFLDVGRQNAKRLNLDADIVFIHDPQPITLIEERHRSAAHWLWRCHIDVSNPSPQVWKFLEPYILKYDAAIYSAPAFTQRMHMRQVLIAPSIDPLSDKNRELEPEEIEEVLQRLGIPRDLPIVTQISRFDYLKDPLGVIEAYRRARKSSPCRLVLLGGPADDDPEGKEVLDLVLEKAKDDPLIHVLSLSPTSHIEVNAVQRVSAVVLQKSLKEGFGLTVSEALWKSRPVVASAVGGIPLQVKHGYNGLLVHSVDGAARAIRQLLNNPAYARILGENGRKHVAENFLLSRHLTDYLLTFVSLEHAGDTILLN